MSVYSPPDCTRPSFEEAVKNEFVPASKGQMFGPSWYTHWFKVEINIPMNWMNYGSESIVFHWNCENEGMVFTSEGNVVVGLSGEERQEWKIPPHMLSYGSPRVFYIETSCNGMFGNADPSYNIQPPLENRQFQLKAADLVVKRLDAEKLKRDFEVIREAARLFPESTWQKHKAIEVANQIIDTFDNTNLEDSIGKCREIAKEFLGSYIDSNSVYSSNGFGGLADDEPVVAVGHCHIDTAWLWPYAETRRKIARSWSSQLDLMERYPEYKFVCSQAIQYQWLKEDYPELFERVRNQVASGRFIPIGGSWVESDTNLPSGESIARQFYYGQKWFQDNFNIKCKTFWLPDTFGYSAQIPQLTRLAEMERFVTQKLSWNNINEFPNTTFNWVALDGTQVLCHMPPADTYNSMANLEEISKTIENHRNTGIDKTGLLVYGYGDGGGGPTADMLERLRRARGVANTVGHVPKVNVGATVDQYFDRVERDTEHTRKLVTWMGELYFEFHRGTYTSEANTKRGNRDCEVLLHDLEYLCSMVAVKSDNYKYPKEELEELWKVLLLNQFHDVLPGSCIEMVYQDAEKLYLDIQVKGRKIFDQAVEAIGGSPVGGVTPAGAGSVSALNTMPWGRTEVVRVTDENLLGNMPQDNSLVQKSNDETTPSAYALYHSDGSGVMSIKPLADISAKGAWIENSGKGNINPYLDAVYVQNDYGNQYYGNMYNSDYNSITLCNEKLRATIASDGTVTSLYDLEEERELIDPRSKANQFVTFEDQPLNWQAWDTEVYSGNKRKEVPAGSVKIVEQGPLRVSVLVEQQISEKSWIKTTISLDAYNPSNPKGNYLEFNSEVEWRENCKFLKAEFPLDIHAESASYDSMFGVTKRPTHYNTFWDVAKFEVACHRYADLSEETYGVTVLNDSKYGFSTHGHMMRLSMLRSPKAPNGNADMGRHHIRYAILGHKGRLDGDVVRVAHNFNQPLRLFNVPTQDFQPSVDLDTVKYEGPNQVLLSTIKNPEENNYNKSLVVRLYDSLGGKTKGFLHTKYKLNRVTKINLLENEVDTDIKWENTDSGAKVQIDLRTFEIASYKLEINPYA